MVKLERASLGEEDRFEFGYEEFQFWVALWLKMSVSRQFVHSGLELWRNIKISNVYLEFKLIEIVAEPGG